jgi:hypothetical protein
VSDGLRAFRATATIDGEPDSFEATFTGEPGEPPDEVAAKAIRLLLTPDPSTPQPPNDFESIRVSVEPL